MNYLALVQELTEELGIGGADSGSGVPSTVISQVGPLGRAVRWIRQANNHINLMWRDWNFLSTDYSEAMTIGSRSWTVHSGIETVRQWDRESFWLNRTTNDATKLQYLDWTVFRRTKDLGAHSVNQTPKWFSVKPDNTVVVDSPPDQAYTGTAEFWKRGVLLSANDDTPDMPEEYHRLIVVTAGIMYGNKEGAPEIIAGMNAEYSVLVHELQSDQAPGFDADTMSAGDVQLEAVIPGFLDPSYDV